MAPRVQLLRAGDTYIHSAASVPGEFGAQVSQESRAKQYHK